MKTLGLAIAIVVAWASAASAGYITISNLTSTQGIGGGTISMRNVVGGHEGFVSTEDGLSPPTFPPNAFQIYSLDDGWWLGGNVHSIDTLGWDIILHIKGSVTDADNYLQYGVWDTTGLTGKSLRLYDKSAPETVYEFVRDGAYHTIPLGNVTHTQGIYGQWRLDVVPVPEPSTLILLGFGIVLMLAHRFRHR